MNANFRFAHKASLAFFLSVIVAGAAVLVANIEPSTDLAGDDAGAVGLVPGGPFELVDSNGKLVTDRDFRGSYMLITFGYTSCPDVCPMTLSHMSAAMDMLGETAEHVQPIFITVDPHRDTPDVLSKYKGLFHPRLVTLTGSADQIANAADAYFVHYGKGEATENGSNYSVDHSSYTYLMGPEGAFREVFAFGTNADKMVTTIKRQLELDDDTAIVSRIDR